MKLIFFCNFFTPTFLHITMLPLDKFTLITVLENLLFYSTGSFKREIISPKLNSDKLAANNFGFWLAVTRKISFSNESFLGWNMGNLFLFKEDIFNFFRQFNRSWLKSKICLLIASHTNFFETVSPRSQNRTIYISKSTLPHQY